MKTIFPTFRIVLTILCIGLFRQAQAVTPPPDGGYPNFTTAEGTNALKNLTSGAANTAAGWYSLFSDTTGSYNTGVGAGTLALNTGDSNTATGAAALFLNTIGHENTANGAFALLNNTEGVYNTAIGFRALFANTIGERNTAVGYEALANGTDNFNFSNTAIGYRALLTNTFGQSNTATGSGALSSNVDGDSNTAVGVGALGVNTSGNHNIAIGQGAGIGLTTGDYNIEIGNAGVAGESNKIRIGQVGTQDGTFIAGISGTAVTGVPVLVSNQGQLGVLGSSQRFKEAIKGMDTESEAILALNPVSFRYKKEIDPAAVAQFGLVAEEVEKVNPDLVTRDAEGKPHSVRYDQVNAMLLNEFLKAHQKVQQQEAAIAQLKADAANQAAAMRELKTTLETVVSRLNEHESKIERVTDRPENSANDSGAIAVR